MAGLPDRFWAKVDMTFFCWEWTGARDKYGYGTFWFGGRVRRAHRVAWEAENGPVPDGLVLDHFACDNPGCVRPGHLRAVTVRENTLRGTSFAAAHARQTHCSAGHPFDDVNTYRARGRRACRACNSAAGRRYRLRKRAA